MLKRIVYGVLGFLGCMSVAVLLGIVINPFKILNSSIYTFQENVKNPNLEKIYDVNFIMTQQPSGNTNIFLPKMFFTDFEQAAYFSEFFGINRNFIEAEESYSFSNENGILEIAKFGGYLKYRSELEPVTVGTQPEDSFIIDAAYSFAKEHLDYFEYEEAEISYNEGIFDLYFIERLGNLKNHAFPTYLRLDSLGNVLSMDYYYNIYEKLSSSPIKSMEDAFQELPEDIGEGIVVDLKQCTLVYYYLDSIVQPCYLFEGEIPGGKSFRSYVRAAIFGQ